MKQRFTRNRAGVGPAWPGAALAALALAGLLSAGTLSAREVYTWTDENGVKHFTDMPPQGGPQQVIEAPEAYKPGSVAPEPPTVEGDDVSTAQARRDAIAQQRATAREARAVNEQVCADARTELERLEPSRRVYAVGEDGESIRMDDEQRVGLVEQLRQFLAENCED